MKKKSKKIEYVKAEVWSVCISESVLDSRHGFSSTIMEVYIPSHNISFNVVNGKVHVFRPATQLGEEAVDFRYRYNKDDGFKNPRKSHDIKLLKEMADTLESYLKLKQEIDLGIMSYWDNEMK